MENTYDNQIAVYTWVYVALVAATLFTAASAFFPFGAVMSVSIALAVAGLKSALIAYYFMHLGSEKGLIVFIFAIGIVAVLILAVGILPDVALKLTR